MTKKNNDKMLAGLLLRSRALTDLWKMWEWYFMKPGGKFPDWIPVKHRIRLDEIRKLVHGPMTAEKVRKRVAHHSYKVQSGTRTGQGILYRADKGRHR